MITRIVKLTFDPERLSEFHAIWKVSRSKIINFDGCIFVEMYQSRDPSNVCFTYSQWDSEDDLNAYRHSDTFAEVWAQTKALFADRPQAWTLDSHGHEGLFCPTSLSNTVKDDTQDIC